MKTKQSGKEIVDDAHYEPTLNPDIKVKLRKPEPPKMNEPYEVALETPNGTLREGKTMFPRNWTPEQVDEAIQYVYENGIYNPKFNRMEGEFAGIKIELNLNSNRKIITGYPKIK